MQNARDLVVRDLGTTILASLVVGLGALLGFALQPLMGRLILPAVGGAASGWLLTLAFFQLAYLFGYGLVHGLARRHVGWLGLGLGGAMLVAGAIFAPKTAGFSPDPLGLWWGLLGAVGLPALLLAMLSSAIQLLVARSSHPLASNPYPLYVVSNIGSLVGLLSYPLFWEPYFTISQQVWLWRVALLLLGLCLLLLALCLRQYRAVQTAPILANLSPTRSQALWWVANSAVPAALIGAVTSAATQEVASFPLLWVIPLALYLLSFIIAFSAKSSDALAVIGAHCAVLLVLMLWLLKQVGQEPVSYMPYLAMSLIAFTLLSLALHRNLADSKPPAAGLTGFYLYLALGGALGGLFNAFIVPLVFVFGGEFYWLLAVGLLLLSCRALINRDVAITLLLVVVLQMALLWRFNHLRLDDNMVFSLVTTVSFFAMLLMLGRRNILSLGLAVLLFMGSFGLSLSEIVLRDRSFFGLLTVADYTATRQFKHGTTLHGVEPKDVKLKAIPTSYYGATSPVGEVILVAQPRKILVVGLGTGQMACYANARRTVDFVEIDKKVVDIARSYFSYLQRCGEGKIFIGDGRLEIEKSTDTYDLIVLDAFSSDAIPIHLLTTEALQIYLKRLSPDGVVAYHLSNRHLDLVPPVAATIKAVGLIAAGKDYRPNSQSGPAQAFENQSIWVMATRDKTLPKDLANISEGWQYPTAAAAPWRDEWSNVVATLRFGFVWPNFANIWPFNKAE